MEQHDPRDDGFVADVFWFLVAITGALVLWFWFSPAILAMVVEVCK